MVEGDADAAVPVLVIDHVAVQRLFQRRIADHQMRALGTLHPPSVCGRPDSVLDAIDPGAGCVDDEPRRDPSLLTGQPVFSADTAVATALAHVQEKPLPPGLRSAFEMPPALEALIMACLSKDPRARPASADDAGRRLAAAVPPDAWTAADARRWWEQHRSAATAANRRDTDSKRSPHRVGHANLVGHAALFERG